MSGADAVVRPTPTARCKLCGKPIVWGIMHGETKDTRIPLDARPACYMAMANKVDASGAVLVTRMESVMVTHFATCPNVDQLRPTVRRAATSPATEEP